MTFCPKCGLRFNQSSPKPSRESLREVKREAKNRQKRSGREKSYIRKRRFRHTVRQVRFGIGALLSLASGVMLIGGGILPWTILTYEDFVMKISASTLYEWLPIYAIVAGLIIIGLTISGSDEARASVGVISLVTVGITAYLWSQLNSLLNLVSGFGGLFSDSTFSISLEDYLKPEIGLILWAGSALIGFASYLFKD
jgi:hypothetical protein